MTSLSSLSEQTMAKPCHFALKLPVKPQIIPPRQLTFQIGVWRQIILTFFANFPVLTAVLSRRPFHPAAAFSKCQLSLPCTIFLRDLDHVLHIKQPLGIYWVLYWIFLMKRSKKWWAEKPTRIDVTQSLRLSDHVPQIIRVDISVLLFFISSLSFLQAENVSFFFFLQLFICNHKHISKKSSLYAILWISVDTRNAFTFPIF